MNESLLDRASTETLIQTLEKYGRCNLLSESLEGLVSEQARRKDQIDQLSALDAYGIRHEQKPLPFECLPYVLKQSTFERISDRFQQLFGILERIIDLYLDDAKVRDFFRLQPRHDRLVRMSAAYRPHIQYCRYDFTLDATGTPRIYELNTHSPAAAVFSDYFSRLLESSRCLDELRKHGLRPLPTPLEKKGAFARAMLHAAKQAGYLRGDGHVAVLNSRYLTMNNELDQIAEQFRTESAPTVRCFVEDLQFDGRQLLYQGTPIHLTYNKFDDSHGPDAYECAFSQSTAEVQPYLDAYRANAVFAINTFPSMYLPEQKSTLAFLWSPLLHKHLERADIALIEEVVPYTVLVRHLSADDRARVAAQPARYVLKRSLDTRGRSVLIGRGMTVERWQQHLAAAIADSAAGDDWVLQQLAPTEQFTTRLLDDGEPVCLFTSLACFLFQGQAAGLIVRTSTEETTNVARQGFIQPPLVVE